MQSYGFESINYWHDEDSKYDIFNGNNEKKKFFDACSKGDVELVNEYISKSKDVLFLVNQKDSFMNTPLHIASSHGHLDIVKILVENDANVNVLNYRKMTPLHFSSMFGYIELTKVLLNTKVSINEQDQTGASALAYACAKGHKEIAKLLIDNGADIYSKMRFLEFDGHTDTLEPIYFACKNGHLEIVRYLLNERNCSPNLCGNSLVTPLHVACQFGKFEIVEELINKGALVNKTDFNDFTPLHEACAYTKFRASEDNLLKIVKLLIKNGAKIDEVTINKFTALDFACDNSYDSIIRYLHSIGAKCDMNNELVRHIINWLNVRPLILARPYDDHKINKKHKLSPLGGIITATITDDHNSVDDLSMQLKMRIAKFL